MFVELIGFDFVFFVYPNSPQSSRGDSQGDSEGLMYDRQDDRPKIICGLQDTHLTKNKVSDQNQTSNDHTECTDGA